MKEEIKRFIEHDLILARFTTLKDLKKYLNDFFNNINIEPFNGKWLKVRGIAKKSYYDSDFQDYEIMACIGTNDEELIDLTIYYCKTRNKQNIIVETAYECYL